MNSLLGTQGSLEDSTTNALKNCCLSQIVENYTETAVIFCRNPPKAEHLKGESLSGTCIYDLNT